MENDAQLVTLKITEAKTKSAKMILPREENCYEIILSTNSSINLFMCGFPPFWQINST